MHEVEPERFAMGCWDAEQKRDVGEGDIYASYSADVIAMMGRVRKPFTFRGQLWVCTGSNTGRPAGSMPNGSTAYRLVPIEAFEGKPVSYTEKTADGHAARADPDGFYHGMAVTHRGQPHVLCGPPVNFIPGRSQRPRESQPSLFPGG